MYFRLRRCFTYANVVATLALFVALGGVSYAALTLPAGSVGTKQLKNHAVTKKKLARGVRVAGRRGKRGARGPQGPPGPATGVAGGALGGHYPDPTLAPPEPWHEVGSAGEPGFETCSVSPSIVAWQNNRPGTDATAAFYRDPQGVVHLKGSIKCPGAAPTGGYFIFRLPAGYLPSALKWFNVSANNGSATVVATNYGSYGYLTYVSGTPGANGRVSLDGITWRCSPSGSDGCP